jgi:hypothetical protein
MVSHGCGEKETTHLAQPRFHGGFVHLAWTICAAVSGVLLAGGQCKELVARAGERARLYVPDILDVR